MKKKWCLVMVLLLTATLLPAQTNNLTALLQQGLFEEQANRNLDAAITDYQTLARQFDQDRQLAATAVFRLGECYRAQGKTNEAAAQYQRIINDFSDQSTLVGLSRQDLTGMGMGKTDAAAPTPVAENADAQLYKKLQGRTISELSAILPTLLPDATLQALLTKRNEVLTQRASLAVDFGPDSIDFRRVNATLDTFNKQIEDRITGMMAALKVRAELPSAQFAKRMDLLDLSPPASSEEDQEITRIQKMIQNSPDLINARGLDGRTLFTQSALKGWLKVVSFLLDHGVDVNSPDSWAFGAAASTGNRAMVELLLSRGAEVNRDHALTRATQKKYFSVIEVLLNNKAAVNDKNEEGRTPLSFAAENADVKTIQLLLAAGADPNLNDNGGRSALGYAAIQHSPEIVKMLLAAKADPNGDKKNVPLLSAIDKRDLASAELLLQAGADPDVIGRTEISGDYDASLMNHREHMTPLWFAVWQKNLPMVRLLLKYKADPENSQTDGQLLLFSALADTNILETLLTAGAKVDPVSPDEQEWTPLGAAADKNLVSSVDILLKHGANPNVRNRNGVRPLHHAVYQLVDTNIFEMLFAAKADPNVRTGNGETPLDVLKKKQTQTDNSADQRKRATELAGLLRRHGALDPLPYWDRIIVSRPANNFSTEIFHAGTNDWNHYTLFELIYHALGSQGQSIIFPDFARIIVARPGRDGAPPKRIAVNLLGATNGISFANDIPLELGDIVEIPERAHTLAEQDDRLEGQYQSIEQYLKTGAGQVRLAVAGSPDVMVSLANFLAGQTYVAGLLNSAPAQQVLTSASDLSHVKIIRHDPKTGKIYEWIFDCSQKNSGTLLELRIDTVPVIGGVPGFIASSNPGDPVLLRNSDLIEVPQKQ